VPPPGGIPADWQDQCADDEHCWSDQGLDVDLLLLLPLQGTRHNPQPGRVHLLLQVGVVMRFMQEK